MGSLAVELLSPQLQRLGTGSLTHAFELRGDVAMQLQDSLRELAALNKERLIPTKAEK
jgi:hypothetical protein